MKNKLYHKLTAAVCALALLLSLAPTAMAEDVNGVSAPSKNINRPTSYNGTHESPIYSNLYANEKGGLTRVEYFGRGGDGVVIEEFDSSFRFQYGSRRVLSMELPKWGGFYAGSQYNFLIFGQDNPQESDSVEVVRVVKYDKSWKRLGQASVYGENTSKPFSFGTLRCAESNGILYIRTCHEMYKSSDGVNHQANMQIAVRENDMSVLNGSIFASYVSHSFNQFILVDQEGCIVSADHGDAYPRAMRLSKYKTNDAAKGSFQASADTDPFPGKAGNNHTAAQLGGLAETANGYLISYAQRSPGFYDPFQIKVSYVAKKDLTNSNGTFQTKQITNSPAPSGGMLSGVSAPVLVPTGLNGGYIIWTQWLTDGGGTYSDRTLYFAAYDANGSVGQICSAPGAMSDCQPIVFNGKVVWYTTDALAPVFYTLDGSSLTATSAKDDRDPNAAPKVLTTSVPTAPAGISSTPSTTPTAPSGTSAFRDVSANHWALAAIEDCAGKGIVKGYSDGRFGPDDQVTSAQFITMMARAFYSEELAAVTAPAGQPWYSSAAKVAEESHMSQGVTVDEQPMSRYEMAATLNNVIHYEPVIVMVAATTYRNGNVYDYQAVYDATKEELKAEVPEEYLNDVAWCYTFRALTGMDDGAFHGERTMTRAQACVVIQRMASLMKGQLPG